MTNEQRKESLESQALRLAMRNRITVESVAEDLGIPHVRAAQAIGSLLSFQHIRNMDIDGVDWWRATKEGRAFIEAKDRTDEEESSR